MTFHGIVLEKNALKNLYICVFAEEAESND